MKQLSSIILALLLSLCFAGAAYADHVYGHCYLENQTDHAGTKVRFQADSPGAETDSTYTDSSGYYHIYLSDGAYDIYYTHQGYYGYEDLNRLLFSSTILPGVTLTQVIGIEISGELSGVLVDTIYLVVGDVWVSLGDSLTIEAGAELIFWDGVQIDINGFIHAAGTYTDSIKLINTSMNWGGIDFNPSSDDSSRLEYCLITGGYASGYYPEYGGGGIYFDQSSPSISNCTISGNSAVRGGGIYCSSSSPTITNCNISRNSAYWGGGGIYCYDYSNPEISNCTISGNSAGSGGGIVCHYSSPSIDSCTISGNTALHFGGGIYCLSSTPTITNCNINGNSALEGGGGIVCHYSSPSIDSCTISGNTALHFGGGIYCLYSSTPSISNCTVIGNSASNSGGGIFCYGDSNPEISNCAIIGNSAELYGGGIYCSYNSTIDMLNTIVEGNNGDYGIYFEGSSGSNSTITYSDFYNNESGNFYNPPWNVGIIVTVNANGDPCDAFYNIFEDPLFYSTTGDSAYYLTAHSPCIDAGDPESPLDPDSTIADIGVHYYDQSPPNIEDLTITVDRNDIILNWTEMPHALSYNIYRSIEPYFDIFGMTPIANVTETQYVDENVLSEGPYFYIITYEN